MHITNEGKVYPEGALVTTKLGAQVSVQEDTGFILSRTV